MSKPHELTKVESSNIEAIGFDRDRQRLLIQFKSSTTVYVYSDVDDGAFAESFYDEFATAESKGKFFFAKIKGRFPFTKEELVKA